MSYIYLATLMGLQGETGGWVQLARSFWSSLNMWVGSTEFRVTLATSRRPSSMVKLSRHLTWQSSKPKWGQDVEQYWKLCRGGRICLCVCLWAAINGENWTVMECNPNMSTLKQWDPGCQLPDLTLMIKMLNGSLTITHFILLSYCLITLLGYTYTE